MPPRDLWGFTLREIDHILRGAAHRDTVNAWMIGRYAAFGFHQPNDYPEFPQVIAPSEATISVNAEIRAIRRRVKLSLDSTRARKKHGN